MDEIIDDIMNETPEEVNNTDQWNPERGEEVSYKSFNGNKVVAIFVYEGDKQDSKRFKLTTPLNLKKVLDGEVVNVFAVNDIREYKQKRIFSKSEIANLINLDVNEFDIEN